MQRIRPHLALRRGVADVAQACAGDVQRGVAIAGVQGGEGAGSGCIRGDRRARASYASCRPALDSRLPASQTLRR
ncbi:protein of unknown function [Thauera humireducens]|nr:protein of unknown function [Thauera humireducens]